MLIRVASDIFKSKSSCSMFDSSEEVFTVFKIRLKSSLALVYDKATVLEPILYSHALKRVLRDSLTVSNFEGTNLISVFHNNITDKVTIEDMFYVVRLLY